MSERFERSLIKLQARLRRFAYGLCGSLDEADDLVQSAYERALSREGQWREGTRLDSWMYRIVQSIWYNQVNARKVRANYVELVHSRPPEEMAEPERGEGAVTLDAVHRCIRDLPEEQRVALLLVAVEGLSYKEVGSVLNVPVGTVTSRIARARQAVKANMESAAASRLTSPMTACDGGHKNAK